MDIFVNDFRLQRLINFRLVRLPGGQLDIRLETPQKALYRYRGNPQYYTTDLYPGPAMGTMVSMVGYERLAA
jgi:hypothetical protein